jgi:hypothetical protein
MSRTSRIVVKDSSGKVIDELWRDPVGAEAYVKSYNSQTKFTGATASIEPIDWDQPVSRAMRDANSADRSA